MLTPFVEKGKAGHGSSIGCASAQYAGCRGFDPHIRQHSFGEFGHEVISMASLSLPLIQGGQLSVTGERMCTNTINVYVQTTGICDSHLL